MLMYVRLAQQIHHRRKHIPRECVCVCIYRNVCCAAACLSTSTFVQVGEYALVKMFSVNAPGLCKICMLLKNFSHGTQQHSGVRLAVWEPYSGVTGGLCPPRGCVSVTAGVLGFGCECCWRCVRKSV